LQNAKAEKPYDIAKRTHKNTSKTFTMPSPSPLVSSASSSPLPGPAVTELCKTCLTANCERYPGLEPQGNWDILTLAMTPLCLGTTEEIYAELNRELAFSIKVHGEKETMKNVRGLLNMHMEITGVKPPPGSTDKYTFIRPILDLQYSVCLFPGGFSDHQYCLDFIDIESGKPVNLPFEYELWGILDPEAPWLSLPMSGKLRLIEHAHGIRQKDILPGHKKFILRDSDATQRGPPLKPDSLCDFASLAPIPSYAP
ncbi:hypothetical protein C8Q78DRAFT_960924, partial [Trametes maxima]